ncbi:MAG TPA: hybrid sensor histidine kinase/response regulator [Aggregatilineaceae bacterium]|nr:hybrid sensor histidine kinase/response regulator [Aggregatilineaceae bacterium]
MNIESGRILIVDDTPANLRLLGGILKAHGYEVYEAVNGTTALQMVDTCAPDLIMLDILMPDMDGYEVCERLKATKSTQYIPIMFISALSDTDGIVKAFTMGGVDYVTKPFQPREVLARVANQITVVNQRRQIEIQREQDRQHFELIDKLKQQFVNTATHDLKNPLNVIIGYAELLDEETDESCQAPFFKDAIENIRRSVGKIRLLVTDMLDLAQIEAGIRLTLEPMSLAFFLDTALQGFSVLAQKKQIELVITLPAEEVTVPICAHQMERAVSNLVSNAIKYTPEGGRVEVSGVSNGEYVLIKVRDTGLGIPEEDMPHLFEAFYRVGNMEHHKIEGTGLGLTAVKSIVDQHQGQIIVESEPGKGSLFCVKLPLIK